MISSNCMVSYCNIVSLFLAVLREIVWDLSKHAHYSWVCGILRSIIYKDHCIDNENFLYSSIYDDVKHITKWGVRRFALGSKYLYNFATSPRLQKESSTNQ